MTKAIITIITVLLVVGVCNVPSLYAELLWDGGYHEFSEGFEGEIDMINGATANIVGGEIGMLLCWDTSSVFVYEPSEISLIKPFNSATVNIYGGSINDVFAVGSSNTNIYNGDINMLEAANSSIITLYVESYEFDPQGGFFQCGLLTGNWLESGNTFSIELETENTINHINFVPEPATLAFFLTGMLLFQSRKRKS